MLASRDNFFIYLYRVTTSLKTKLLNDIEQINIVSILLGLTVQDYRNFLAHLMLLVLKVLNVFNIWRFQYSMDVINKTKLKGLV